ncbi:hypothetical protein J6590_089700 [Homalodisca vitripennis]|nr:hypothetical protein J6590_089700 [Homalodisca vitripennis]
MGLTIEDLKPLLEDMKKEILKGQNNIEKEINKSIEMCFNMIKENSKTTIVAKQQEIITSQQTKIEGLEEENKYLRAQVKDISRLFKEEYFGDFRVPEASNESEGSLKQTVIDIGNALGVPIQEDGIDACHRMYGGKNRPASGIIVKCLRREDPDRLLARRKVKRDFSTRHLVGRKDDLPIYINLSLSRERRVLFAKARELRPKFNYKYVWVDRAGRVKVRKSDDKSSRVCVLNYEDDLSALIKRESGISDRELFDARYVVYRSDRDAETSGKCRGGGVLLAVNKRLHARRLSGQRRQLIADTLCVKVTAPPPHSHHALYINVVYFPPNIDVHHPLLVFDSPFTQHTVPKLNPSSTTDSIEYYSFKNAKFFQLYCAFRDSDWSSLFKTKDIDEAVDLFYNTVFSCIDQFVPKIA